MKPTNIDITLYRRQATELIYRIPANLTGYTVYFVVKQDKEPGSNKIIEKVSTNSEQIIYGYEYPYTYLTVKIVSADTESLVNERFYYELYAVNDSNPSDLKVYYYGKMNLVISVSTPTDVAGSMDSIYYDTLTTVQRLALGSTLGLEDEGKVIIYDTDDDTVYTWTGDGWH
jgi:hypothetical protein